MTRAGYTPLHVACHFGQMGMVRFLLEQGVPVDVQNELGYSPLHQVSSPSSSDPPRITTFRLFQNSQWRVAMMSE